MNSSIIEIHEFSTGIRSQQTADGGWVSLGFTGQYMNATIVRIPDAVEISIANREFAVAEGASSDQPAIIGRVLGTGEDTWSVIAIVTRGRDEKGRSASMYRYFLTQGSEGYQNLRLILAWWESQETPLTFNPFDVREMGKPNLCNVDETSTQFRKPSAEAIAIPVNTPEPILLTPQQQYDLQALNTLAFKKYNANKNGQAISWAFNVEALEKPERFLVIQAASDRAYQILQKAITSTPKILAPVLTDEEALKSAIRGLMNSSQVKPENIKIIADALANKQITSAYWHTLFDGQGAKTAIAQKIYSPQMVRLITLRAVVIPETMLEFLGWLNIKPGQKPDDNQTVSLEFQNSIRRNLPQDKLANSIKSILPELLKQSSIITPESIRWLLKSNDSAWAACYQEFINDILYDLKLIVNSLKDKTIIPSDFCKCDPQTWESLNNSKKFIYSSYSHHKQEEYASFAKLFESLQEYPLSAYFYQVSQDIVPKKIFERLPNSDNNYVLDFIGLRLNREVTFLEEIIYYLFYWRYIVPIQVVVILSIFLSILSFTGGVLLERRSQSSNNGGAESVGVNTTAAIEKSSSHNWKINGSQDFERTRKAIDEIIININKEEKAQSKKPTNRKEIIQKIKVVLNVEKYVNYDNAKPSAGKDTDNFVYAIYEYQKSQFPNNKSYWDGIIIPKGKTATKLEEDVKNKLELQN
ncbi:hypothetical protein ANA_C13476 [Anabaena sp. 90]|uniref:hypothetical protein n=1 Tax=Anabaena sp. 90 TaxID=46234 RepID=UPI00029B76DD|nr:hypothetical protein [Anabaena sp. 90]AFW96138.1 hypothetical protein ANA_C13476 [Anabaena sp. 90]